MTPMLRPLTMLDAPYLRGRSGLGRLFPKRRGAASLARGTIPAWNQLSKRKN
jgi:hypothetical protein